MTDILMIQREFAMNKLAVFDIDGTLRTERSPWRFLHSYLGLSEKAADYYPRYKSQEISYLEWVNLDAALWKGIPRAKIVSALDHNPLRQGAAELVDRFRTKGYDLLAISTGLDVFNDVTCKALGIQKHISNQLKFDKDGICTGRVDILVNEISKGITLDAYIARSKKKFAHIFAAGDGEADIPLFQGANDSLAVMPMSEAVRSAATYCVEKEPINLAAFCLK